MSGVWRDRACVAADGSSALSASECLDDWQTGVCYLLQMSNTLTVRLPEDLLKRLREKSRVQVCRLGRVSARVFGIDAG